MARDVRDASDWPARESYHGRYGHVFDWRATQSPRPREHGCGRGARGP